MLTPERKAELRLVHRSLEKWGSDTLFAAWFFATVTELEFEYLLGLDWMAM